MPEDKKHFDVAQPGQIPVSHTSRPVIVGQQDVLAGDPMMRVMDSEQPHPVSDHKVSLQPIHPDTKSETTVSSGAGVPTPESSFSQAEGAEAPAVEALTPSENPEIQKLITEKTYKLPIKSPARKALGLIVAILIIIALVAVAGAYFMMNR